MLAKNLLDKISAKTAAYQILPSDLGTVFTNRGTTAAVAFTLPNTADIPTGWNCKFRVVGAGGLSVASYGSSDNVVAPNDATADSITITTTSLIIGASLEVQWDGTGWLTDRGGFGTYTVA